MKLLLLKDHFISNGDLINQNNSVKHLGWDLGDFDSNIKAIDKTIGDLYMRTNCLNLVILETILEICLRSIWRYYY